MNKRTLSIIQVLSDTEKDFSIKGLAESFSVSTRTIRNDLNSINDFLKENGLSALDLKRGGAVIRQSDFSQAQAFLMQDDFYQYKLSREEREQLAAVLLVTSTGYLTLSAIAESLFVSRATIISDLNGIKSRIKKGGLEVISHPNKGLRVEGKESDKRLFLMRISDKKASAVSESMVKKQISVTAGNRIILQKIITEQEHIHKSFLTDHSFEQILLYLGILINRVMAGELIEPQSGHFDGKYRMAQDILRYVSQYCHVSVTEDEVNFLSGRLEQMHYIREKHANNDIIKIQLITRQFIEGVSEELAIDLSDDYDFFESLSNHLQSVFSEQPPAFVENPIIDEVLEDNPDVLHAVKVCLPVILNHMSREMTDMEVGYIAVHICAALERKKNREIAFHVIVACHAGIGTSHLLLEKLKQHFNFQIVDIISSHETAGLKKGAADFIISTVPLKNCALDYVVVSPLLSDEDYLRVGNKIDALRNSRSLPSRIEEREISARGIIERIRPIIYEEVPDLAPALMKRLRKEIRSYMNQSVEAEAEIFSPYLHHLLPASHIQLDVECTDWKDAIRKSAEKLLDSNYIEERYIDAMIRNVEENGPYIILSPGFAMPHEGLEEGSIKVGMNLIRLKTPVYFPEDTEDTDDTEDMGDTVNLENPDDLTGEEYDETETPAPVEFVCCLSAVDHKTHLKAIFNLVNMLQSGKFLPALRACRTPEEAALTIEKSEYC